MIRAVLAVALFSAAALPAAHAASFDCARASTPIEHQVCEDPTLSAADESMAESFRALRDKDPVLVADQSEWLAERDQCATVECLSAAYLARIDQLDARRRQAAPAPLPAEAPPTPAPPVPAINPKPAPAKDLTAATPAGQNSPPSDPAAQQAKTPSKPRSLEERAQSEAFQLILLGVVLFLLTILILGANHRVVIYYDLMDFSWSFLWIISLFVAIFVGGALLYKEGSPDPTLTGMIVIGLGTVTAIFSFIKVFWNSVKYNQSLPTGLIVGLFKIIFGVTFVLFLALASQTDQQQRRRRTNWVVAAISAFLVVVLYRSAINGPEVYARRGWPPPA